MSSNTHRAQLPGTGETRRPPAATSPGTGQSQSDSKRTERPQQSSRPSNLWHLSGNSIPANHPVPGRARPGRAATE
uniref:Uncharacterized protein n=1 Tax=Pongo abelii TaxID=9601 RepID=H2P5Q3_PONAB